MFEVLEYEGGSLIKKKATPQSQIPSNVNKLSAFLVFGSCTYTSYQVDPFQRQHLRS